MECLTYNTAQSYRIAEIFQFLQTQSSIVQRFNDVVFCGNDKKFVYIFAFGGVVFWGFRVSESLAFLKSIASYADEPLLQFDTEIFSYRMGNKTLINELEDTIILEKDTDELYTLALSYALAQSIKLLHHEKELKKTIDQMITVPKNLANTGKTSLKPKEIAQKIGTLYLQKWSIQSVSFRQTPRVIWDNSEIAPYYNMASEFLDLQSRTKVLNNNLTMIQDLLEMLGEQLNTRRGVILEWVIIILILIEVLLIVTKDILHWL